MLRWLERAAIALLFVLAGQQSEKSGPDIIPDNWWHFAAYIVLFLLGWCALLWFMRTVERDR